MSLLILMNNIMFFTLDLILLCLLIFLYSGELEILNGTVRIHITRTTATAITTIIIGQSLQHHLFLRVLAMLVVILLNSV